jgi:L-iditol 2-dehydrogenase
LDINQRHGDLPVKNMMAAVFYGPNDISVQTAPLLRSQFTLKVNACAVCGYDARVFRNGHRKVTPPVILGHEICGDTLQDVAMQDGVTIRAGTRVALCPIIPCLGCHYCNAGQYNLCMHLKEIGSTLDGGFAQYVSVPEQTIRIGGLVPVPDSLGDEEASLLEPLACCLNGFYQLNPAVEERPVVVIGDGPIGLLHLQLLKNLAGARVAVVGRVQSRMEKAKSIGTDAVFKYNDTDKTASDMLDFTGEAGAGIVVISTSNPSAFELATKVAGRNSKINMFAGMPAGQRFSLDANWLHYNQVSLMGAFSSTPPMLREAARIAAEGTVNLSEIVTHRYPLAQIEKAILVTERYSGLRAVINRF